MKPENIAAGFRVAGLSPSLVVAPGSPEEIAEVIHLATQFDMAIIPWGGGTMMERGFVPAAYDVALSLSRICGVVDFDVANLTATVQAGSTLADLQSHLRQANQFLPLNPPLPNRATIGGSIAANSSGPGRFRYGSARDLVLGMRVALANGEIIHVGGKTVKNVAGYDLSKMFIGSYGTLGIVTEVTLRLLPCPQTRKALRAAFDNVDTALDLSARLLDSELLPTSLSVMNHHAAQLVLNDGEDGCALIVSIDGSIETVERQATEMSTIVNSAGARSVTVLEGSARDAIVDAVRDFVPSNLAVSRTMAFTANLPIAMTGPFVSEIEKLASHLSLITALLVAADTGTVSCLLEGVDMGHLVEAYSEAVSTAACLGGHCVLNYAAPELRRQVAVWGQPRDDWKVTRVLKKQFDPGGLFNRGRFVDGI